MNTRTVLSQLLQWIPRYEFQEGVDQYDGDKKVRKLPCWSQFVGLLFGQLIGHKASLPTRPSGSRAPITREN